MYSGRTFAIIPCMKIMQILPALEQGGVERGTIEIASALTKAGIENAVVSSGGPMVAQLEKMGVKHYTMSVQSKNPFVVWRNGNRLAEIVRKEGFTLMHVRSRAPAWSVMRASRLTGVPYISTYHGLYGTKPAWLKKPYNRVMLKGVRTIAVSECVLKHIIDNYGTSPEKLVLIYRGADTTLFNGKAPRAAEFRRSLGFTDDTPVITLPGRLTFIKGQKDLLAAAALMKTHPLGLLFVGSDQGRKEYSAELRDIASKMPDGVKVVFVEHSSDMPTVYGASDVVVSANSAKPEAFGRTIPEAQAMGRLVVGTAHGGACETIIDGVTGFLVPPADPPALAKKLDEVLSMPREARREMCERAQARAREDFSTEKMCRRTIELYASLSK